MIREEEHIRIATATGYRFFYITEIVLILLLSDIVKSACSVVFIINEACSAGTRRTHLRLHQQE
jgi:hypothetical protein